MAKSQGSFYKGSETHNVVYDYKPKEFPLVVSAPARDFVSAQHEKATDFQISDIVAQQSGVAELQKKSIEARVEELALERLKAIEEKAYREAYELGLIEGAERALAEHREQFAANLSRMDAMLEQFEKLKFQLLNDCEAQLVGLVNLIARKIAFKEVNTDRETVVRIIAKLVEDLQNVENIVVKISNEDFAFVEELRERVGRKADFLNRVKLEPAEDVQSGGAILETDFGMIDASVEQRVDRVWAAMESKIPRLRQVADAEAAPSEDAAKGDDDSSGEKAS